MWESLAIQDLNLDPYIGNVIDFALSKEPAPWREQSRSHFQLLGESKVEHISYIWVKV